MLSVRPAIFTRSLPMKSQRFRRRRILSKFFGKFDAEWRAISGEFSEKGAKIRSAQRVCPVLSAIGGFCLARIPGPGCDRNLDFEQNRPNQNDWDFMDRLLAPI